MSKNADAGNLWRRRLLVHQADGQSTFNPANEQKVSFQSRNDTFSQALNPVGKYAGEVTNLRPSSPGTVDMYLGFVPLGPRAYHAYTILTGPNGETYAIRGGPMNSYGNQEKPGGGLAAAYDVLSNSIGPETFGNLVAADTDDALQGDRNNTVSRYHIGSVNMPFDTAVDRMRVFRDAVNNAMVGYHPLMMNSNSFAFEAPTALGLPRPNPDDYPHAPGASRTIRRR